ncbi:diaminopimelate decarboxylase [Mesoterricola silvestris]|uniref:Diaminopimelate decarboxylase n=1 Tax=Mesoterricola silvestris TaxID=2927979 RepID=A0AA48GRT8_9BACT|nr:diaminopimelate decarboxylase [Mesoterricola silvestris]BDU72842.1 diaminopimelate decarboxylase [Mesoterricola silvestris]
MSLRPLSLALLLLAPALLRAADPTLHEALVAVRADKAGDPAVARVLQGLASAHGTPLYVYDQAHIRGQVASLKAAFAPRFPKLRVLYALKANTNPSIIGLLKGEGLGAEVVSLGEIEWALRTGYKGSEIMFTSSSKNPAELRRAIALGAVLNVDSLDELGQVRDEARRQKKQARISFRVNPGVDPHTIHQINTGITESKFGLHLQDGIALRAYEQAKAMPEIRIEGLHCHIGSQITETEGYTLTAKKMLAFVKELKDKLGLRLAFVDLGGGLGIPYKDGQAVMSPEDLARALEPIWKEGVAAAGYEPTLWLEPGRFFVGGSGFVLVRVNTVKQTPVKTFVNVDAGFNTLMRPILYQAYHRVRVLGKSADPVTVDIAGDVCETGDILAEARTLPRAAAGDLLAILDAGAYGFSMASEYNSRPMPAELLVDGNRVRVIRRRGGFGDIFRNTGK